LAFAGVRPVLHLPFGPGWEQPVVHAQLRSLVEAMLAAGVDGLVALGLASEAWTVTEPERDAVVRTAADAIDGRVPLVVGLDGATAVAVDRGRRAAAAGAAGLMVLPPGAARTTDQVVAHYARLADATGLPILVQDSPQVTGVTLTLDTIVALAAHPLVRALKVEIPGAGAKTSAAHAAGVEIVAGWGGLGYLDSIARGASGCMPGCDLGPAIVAIDRLARAGDPDGADALYRAILPLLAWEAQSLDLLLLGAKRHLVRRGIFADDALRAPGRRLDEQEDRALTALLDRLAADGVPGFAPDPPDVPEAGHDAGAGPDRPTIAAPGPTTRPTSPPDA
jgi:4-hydroxy-tetrahydrodipicolinate synthase